MNFYSIVNALANSQLLRYIEFNSTQQSLERIMFWTQMPLYNSGKLPEIDDEVIVKLDYNRRRVAAMRYGGFDDEVKRHIWYWHNSDDMSHLTVTAWMPFPDPDHIWDAEYRKLYDQSQVALASRASAEIRNTILIKMFCDEELWGTDWDYISDAEYDEIQNIVREYKSNAMIEGLLKIKEYALTTESVSIIIEKIDEIILKYKQ